MRYILLLSIFGVSSFFVNGELKAQATIKWMSLEQATQQSQKKPKKILIDVYTDWCTWCKYMDKNTYANESIASYINQNYYPVKFNAEQKDDLNYKGKTYHFVKTSRGGYHELAAELLKGQLAFPSTIFLDENQNVLQSIQGYKDPSGFEMILVYFGENHHKNTPWTKFERDYQTSIKKKVIGTEKPNQVNVKGN